VFTNNVSHINIIIQFESNDLFFENEMGARHDYILLPKINHRIEIEIYENCGVVCHALVNYYEIMKSTR